MPSEHAVCQRRTATTAVDAAILEAKRPAAPQLDRGRSGRHSDRSGSAASRLDAAHYVTTGFSDSGQFHTKPECRDRL